MNPYVIPIGLLVLAGSALLLHRTIMLVREGVRTRGTVVRVDTRHDGKKTMYTPVVQFTGPGGRAVTFTSNVDSSGSRFHAGDDIGVLYREERPDKAQIDTPFGLWGAPAITGLFGAVLIGMALSGMTFRRGAG